jgi:hypothetical protein
VNNNISFWYLSQASLGPRESFGEFGNALIMWKFLKQCYRLIGAIRARAKGSHFCKMKSGSPVALVLGNGPSLNADLSKILEIIEQNKGLDIYCVNSFPTTRYFNQLKPQHIVLADPGFWQDDLKSDFLESRENLLKTLSDSHRDNVVNIYLPQLASRQLQTISRYRSISNCNIFFYNTNSWSFRFLKNVFYRWNIAVPIIQNVLVAALYFPLVRGAKKVYLFGADHSWVKNMVLRDDNVLCFEYEHFFGEKRLKPFYKDVLCTTTFTLKEYFKATYIEFEALEEIQNFSNSMRAQILNLSSRTFIDTFKRSE